MLFEDTLKRIQSSDEGTKRRWLIMGTTVIMMIVVFVWLRYFNTLLQVDASGSQLEASAVENTTGVATMLYQRLTEGMRAFKN